MGYAYVCPKCGAKHGQEYPFACLPSDSLCDKCKVLDDVISLINKNTFELEGKRLKISVLLLLQEIDKLREG